MLVASIGLVPLFAVRLGRLPLPIVSGAARARRSAFGPRSSWSS
jgi:hypothetical protein